MKIYDFPLSPNCRKVRAVAYELGLTPTFVPVQLFKGEQHRPELAGLNPNERVPVLVDGDFVLWESNAIVGYLAAGTRLLPDAARPRADVQRWCDWELSLFGPAVRKVAFERLVKPLTGRGPADPKVVEEGIADYRRLASVLETSLSNKAYVAGSLSTADFVLAAIFSIGTADAVGLETAPFPRVHAWLGRMMERDAVRRAVADAAAVTR